MYLHTFFTKIKPIYIVVVSILIILVSTLPALLQQSHTLYNLEPYPDGLLYSLSARNLVVANTLALTYKQSVISYWVPPLYSCVLSTGYLVNSSPQTFYLVNIFLLLATVCTISWIVLYTTNSKLLLLFAIILYLSHAYVLWLPTIPMSENLCLFLFAVLIALLLKKGEIGYKVFFTLLLISLALVATKYSAFPLAAAAVAIVLIRLISNKSYKLLAVFFFILIGGIAYITISNNEILLLFNYSILTNILVGNSPYFSLELFNINSVSYLQALFTTRAHFLWQTTPLTSIPMGVAFLILLYKYFLSHDKYNIYQALVLLAQFISQFALVIFFYTVDSRYIIFTIILFTIGSSLLLHEIIRKTSVYIATLIFCFVLIVQISTQTKLYKEIFSANILGRSAAWQYEAIKHFNSFTKEHPNQDASPVIFITALPPFLVDAYQDGTYRVVPLSQHQEFIAKGQTVWGSDVNYENLIDGYIDWIRAGKKVYISNSYITHQQSVISDYEYYKTVFTFELVSSGCMDACNIYQIRLK